MGPPRSRSVLIVDDDSSIRSLLVAILRRRGYRMLQARNGREALAEMRTGNTDLVVMDLVMPEVSGWEVLRERAADPALLQIPIIVVSATNSLDVATGVLDKQVYAVIAKPFDVDLLLKTVAACLERPDVPALAAA